MGVKSLISKTTKKVAGKAADKVANLAALSPKQLEEVEKKKEQYMNQMPDPSDPAAVELTSRLIASCGVEIYNSYLPQLSELYVPVENSVEYDQEFNSNYNTRFVNITKWVTDRDENSIEKLINVYEVLSNEDCNIALVFNRTAYTTNVYLAVTNTKNDDHNNDANDFISRLTDAVKGNFPGSEMGSVKEGRLPFFKGSNNYSVATASNIPTEKSKEFISQTIEKILDGIVPGEPKKDYTIILLATPIQDVEERKNKLSSIYSALNPYAAWQTNFTYTQSDSVSSMATFGVNVGASAGVQNTQSSSSTQSDSTTDSTGGSTSDNQSSTNTDSTSDTTGTSSSTTDSSFESQGTTTGTSTATGSSTSHGTNTTEGSNSFESSSTNLSATEGVQLGVRLSATEGYTSTSGTGTSFSESISDTFADSVTDTVSSGTNASSGTSIANTIGQSASQTIGRSVANTVGKTVANTFGKAVTTGVATMAGVAKATSFGMNAGANFARSSTITATVGKNEGITQSFVNHNIKHALEKLDSQMKRYETSTALGMWDFAAYVVSEDVNIANNVAHTYVALTQGEESYMSQAAINVWRGDMGERSSDAKEIISYLKDLRHPIFGLNPNVVNMEPTFLVYPNIVNATTALSGKELAYSLNFPRKSVPGLSVFECAEFGRNVVKYDESNSDDCSLKIGQVFHMNHIENVEISISKNSLASHTFVTGSTGSGKSNTVYTILDKAMEADVNFLVVEPAKGEYKNVFGQDSDVHVYGTNKKVSDMLRINPFSFPASIHVLEHMDRLVELFNVCWPMYAAMPAVLKEAIEKSYSDCGWDLEESTNSFGNDLYPCFADVARNVKYIIDSSEYDNENKGAYKGSLLTRLKSLTNGINGQIFSQNEISGKELFDENVIVDISRVGSSETKSLIMGMLVLKLQEYRISESKGMNSSLKHLTVLEEAHNILKRTSSDVSSESGNLLGKSVEMVSNAIAEMRSFGEGFIIADQAPGLLDMSAIRNTNTKIIMRLPDMDDRELVGRAANLNDNQILELAKLPCGVAAIYQNEWIQPVLCKIDKIMSDNQMYSYTPTKTVVDKNIDKRIQIAEMLSRGVKIGTEDELKDINNILSILDVPSFIRVSSLKMLNNPPKEPRMTKIAPIMNALFPEVTEEVRRIYSESHVPSEWTEVASSSLKNLGVENIDSTVRRDIIQGIITYYLFTEIQNETALREWHTKGELR